MFNVFEMGSITLLLIKNVFYWLYDCKHIKLKRLYIEYYSRICCKIYFIKISRGFIQWNFFTGNISKPVKFNTFSLSVIELIVIIIEFCSESLFRNKWSLVTFIFEKQIQHCTIPSIIDINLTSEVAYRISFSFL